MTLQKATYMISVRPAYSRKAVTRAGQILSGANSEETDVEEYFDALDILSNWRASHSYPINTFQATLRAKIKALTSASTIVAQRLKRTPSIIYKLQRNPGMELARMQDIGGLRAVMPGIPMVRKLHLSYTENERRFQHTFGIFKDYITCPKEDGYRGLHQVFKYRNASVPFYDGLQIELQIRSRLQHSWATAVETMSTFLNQGLKVGGGDQQYREYLKICSALFCHLEKCPGVPGYEQHSFSDLKVMLTDMERELEIIPKLQGFSVAAQNIDVSGKPNSAYHLVILNIPERKVRVRSFTASQLDEATEAYAEAEKQVQAGQRWEVVLVSAGPIRSLKKAYPNYFLDTDNFVQTVTRQII
ncbi:RelA/SpoT domain-containing protein [Bordetella bronchiseptica]|uniref:RelA/SpoT domain-containing protein n=1 Tax=Bordetella bronchiseptica TaxID=518 RepID=UPI003EDC8F16